jgi:hypothetical protein
MLSQLFDIYALLPEDWVNEAASDDFDLQAEKLSDCRALADKKLTAMGVVGAPTALTEVAAAYFTVAIFYARRREELPEDIDAEISRLQAELKRYQPVLVPEMTERKGGIKVVASRSRTFNSFLR